MKRSQWSVVLGTALGVMLLAPSSAQAWFGGGWLERLSGPGPFTADPFEMFEIRFLCFGPDDREANDDFRTQSPEGFAKVQAALNLPLGHNSWLGAGCNFLAADQRRLEIGISRGSYSTTTNPLVYEPPLGTEDRRIDLRMWLFTADVRVNRTLDVGVGFGPAEFKGAPFETLDKWVWQPLRLTLRPLTPLGDSKKLEALVFRFSGQRFSGGFHAEEFGAKPGTFDEPGEFLATWAIIVDFGAFVWPG